ncbi:hypothetical protein [Salinigranum sp.]|uniref:DUF7322 domain-containing protein n=1 Tax=Salinigranum sp. TaxID=1966351 RepID=UPI00356B5173
MFEPWPDEPDESDAERRWGNPERDLPRVPEVSTGETDVDPDVFKAFWTSVIFANVALFGVSLGAMLWFFRGQALLGGILLFAGVLAGLRTYASYRAFENRDPEEAGDGDDSDEDGEGDDSGEDRDGGEDGGSKTPDDRADSAARQGVEGDDEPAETGDGVTETADGSETLGRNG